MNDKVSVLNNPAISEISTDTLALIDFLRTIEVGEVVTYKQIKAAIGVDLRKRRHPMSTARKHLLMDHHMHFDCVRSVGYRRLTHAEAAKQPNQNIRRARKAAKNGLRIASRVNILEIPESDRPAFVGTASLCGLMADVGSARSRNKLIALAASDTSGSIVSAQKALEALKD